MSLRTLRRRVDSVRGSCYESRWRQLGRIASHRLQPSSAEIAASKGCIYPQSSATSLPIMRVLDAVAANRSRCTSFYLDTVEGMSNDWVSSEGEDHHQGLGRTHKLSDGSIYFFLSHSEVDPGDKG